MVLPHVFMWYDFLIVPLVFRCVISLYRILHPSCLKFVRPDLGLIFNRSVNVYSFPLYSTSPFNHVILFHFSFALSGKSTIPFHTNPSTIIL